MRIHNSGRLQQSNGNELHQLTAVSLTLQDGEDDPNYTPSQDKGAASADDEEEGEEGTFDPEINVSGSGGLDASAVCAR
jgi:hypothetical protein